MDRRRFPQAIAAAAWPAVAPGQSSARKARIYRLDYWFIRPGNPPFAGLAEREKAWDTLAADPEWMKVREASVAMAGQIVAEGHIMVLRPAPFSPMQ
jgi:hypothetical protein